MSEVGQFRRANSALSNYACTLLSHAQFDDCSLFRFSQLRESADFSNDAFSGFGPLLIEPRCQRPVPGISERFQGSGQTLTMIQIVIHVR
jgi:hypothetical protein